MNFVLIKNLNESDNLYEMNNHNDARKYSLNKKILILKSI